MYIIIVYDIEQKRVGKVCQYLRRYLNWVQNSVFEGEVTEAKLKELKIGLKKLIRDEVDSVFFYGVRDQNWLNKETMGVEKNPTDTFI
ncbi:MAG: CRISPR-associated endonuclease Cas2 [Ignavibacteria bacterium]|nr:CRISPR-associated endonuclease Cas2 [Ignavibacteria bacterium]